MQHSFCIISNSGPWACPCGSYLSLTLSDSQHSLLFVDPQLIISHRFTFVFICRKFCFLGIYCTYPECYVYWLQVKSIHSLLCEYLSLCFRLILHQLESNFKYVSGECTWSIRFIRPFIFRMSPGFLDRDTALVIVLYIRI